MAFTSVITHKSVAGNVAITYGTYVSTDDDTGGDINTNTDVCHFIKLQPTGASTQLLATSADETFPCDGKAVTVVTNANESGNWFAIGEGIGW
ncbi:MAG: hypothetical protein WC365_10240 [Candidatus Babeliales bacterium]|jgi:hypothetical protein